MASLLPQGHSRCVRQFQVFDFEPVLIVVSVWGAHFFKGGGRQEYVFDQSTSKIRILRDRKSVV